MTPPGRIESQPKHSGAAAGLRSTRAVCRSRSPGSDCSARPFPYRVKEHINIGAKTTTARGRAAAERWAAAVNADGQFGAWRFAMARSIPGVREILDRQVVQSGRA